MILGISFNSFFPETMELKRKQNYESAWKNYLEQRWKIDLGKITGYIWWTDIWHKLSLGNKDQLISSLNSDATIRKHTIFFQSTLIQILPNLFIEFK